MIDTFHFTLSPRRLRDKIALSGVPRRASRERARRATRAPRARPAAAPGVVHAWVGQIV